MTMLGTALFIILLPAIHFFAPYAVTSELQTALDEKALKIHELEQVMARMERERDREIHKLRVEVANGRKSVEVKINELMNMRKELEDRDEKAKDLRRQLAVLTTSKGGVTDVKQMSELRANLSTCNLQLDALRRICNNQQSTESVEEFRNVVPQLQEEVEKLKKQVHHFERKATSNHLHHLECEIKARNTNEGLAACLNRAVSSSDTKCSGVANAKDSEITSLKRELEQRVKEYEFCAKIVKEMSNTKQLETKIVTEKVHALRTEVQCLRTKEARESRNSDCPFAEITETEFNTI